MKKLKTKLIINLIGAIVILAGVGFSRVGHTEYVDAVRVAEIKFAKALEIFKTTFESRGEPESGTSDRGVDLALASLLNAAEAIQSEYDAAREASLANSNSGDLTNVASEWENLLKATQETLLQVTELLKTATSSDQSPAPTPATPPSAQAPSSQPTPTATTQPSGDSGDGNCESDCGDETDPYVTPPESVTPNPEGETSVSGTVSPTIFDKSPTITDRRLTLINPNPELATYSSVSSPFKTVAPTFAPNAPLIIPTEDSGIKVSRIDGVAIPTINLRAPYINPNPESDGTVSGQTSGTFGITKLPTINPIGPVASSIRKIGTRRLQNAVISGTLSR